MSSAAPGLMRRRSVSPLHVGHRHALEQRDAPAQAVLEVGDLAAHGGFGDGGDLGRGRPRRRSRRSHSMLISVESMSKAINVEVGQLSGAVSSG